MLCSEKGQLTRDTFSTESSDRSHITELCGPFPIRGDASPAVGPSLVLVGAKADHRLDGEAHTRFGHPNSFVLSIVWYVWRAME